MRYLPWRSSHLLYISTIDARTNPISQASTMVALQQAAGLHPVDTTAIWLAECYSWLTSCLKNMGMFMLLNSFACRAVLITYLGFILWKRKCQRATRQLTYFDIVRKLNLFLPFILLARVISALAHNIGFFANTLYGNRWMVVCYQHAQIRESKKASGWFIIQSSKRVWASYRCRSGKLWYLQHSCVGDTIVYHYGSDMGFTQPVV